MILPVNAVRAKCVTNESFKENRNKKQTIGNFKKKKETVKILEMHNEGGRFGE